jgi:hypothetical protein
MPAKPANATKKRSMSQSHKDALAEGREQGRTVRNYLEALEANRPKRGRKRTPESIQKRLGAIAAKVSAADPLTRVQLIQEQMDLESELAALQNGGADVRELEKAFVKAAKPYSRRKGITYTAWRAVGVDASVLKKAGIMRSG